MNKYIYSRIINIIKFPLICCIIFLHCYTSVDIDNETYWRLIYPFIIIGELGVPTFFFISGFLFFFNISEGNLQYRKKINSRIHSLIIPYLIWNSLMLIILLISESMPYTKSFLSNNYNNIGEYNLGDIIKAYIYRGDWNGGYSTPILSTMWYIRNLVILSIISPIIYYLIKRLNWIPIIILGLCWILSKGEDFTQSSLFFFSLGSYIKINSIDILSIKKQTKILFLFINFILFITDYLTHIGNIASTYSLIIHKVNLLLCIYAVFIIGEIVINKVKYNQLLSDSTFFIYAFHFPLVLALRRIEIKIINTNNGIIHFSIYLFSSLLTIAICILLFIALRRKCPKLLNIITGNRA